MISFALALLAAAPAAQQTGPTYAEALRCEALTMIEAARLDVNDPAHAPAFDAGAEWHMATVHIVLDRGITPERYGEELETATDKARADLEAGGDAVRAELAACIRTAPPIPR